MIWDLINEKVGLHEYLCINLTYYHIIGTALAFEVSVGPHMGNWLVSDICPNETIAVGRASCMAL